MKRRSVTTIQRTSAPKAKAKAKAKVPVRTAVKVNRKKWKIHCTIESKALRVPPNTLRAITKRILAEVVHEIAIPEVHELHIMIINDARMREINFEFRHKDKPTDVLSFPQYTPQQIRGTSAAPEAASPYLGDLVISSETTKRQAKRFGVTVRQELLRLIVHGVLHLIGYDHEGVPAREAQAMRRRERSIRSAIPIR